MPNDTDKLITGIARNAIAAHLGLTSGQAIPEQAWLTESRACFVTLHKHGALRGCIGSLVAHRPLGEDIVANALAAALHDPRFPPLTADEI
ncbi:MAG: AMMECR1 domain-containing protein, partial [Mariprofundaceae bacterium]|nr:AMMECR1 domain-containing protein [Mariprofundaceae bacterium]